jgi:hypothetical protein
MAVKFCVAEGFDRVFLFSGIMLFLTLVMFIGRLFFGWFKYIKPNKYRVSPLCRSFHYQYYLACIIGLGF